MAKSQDAKKTVKKEPLNGKRKERRKKRQEKQS